MVVRTRTKKSRRTASEKPSCSTHICETDEARMREAGGPEDEALYSCECGHSFMAEVSVGVDCPLCGATQSW